MKPRRSGTTVARIVSRLVSVSGVVSVALLLPLTTFLVCAWLLGWQLQAVLSGSMSPTYPVGSLLVIGSIDASQVEPGMAIVFEDPRVRGRVVTHRVVAQAPGDRLQFWTQGDANVSRDPVPVPARMVHGRVLWQISHLGAVVAFLQGGAALPLLVGVPVVLVIAGELTARLRWWRRPAAVRATNDS